jgi:hypothetical protein
MKYYFELVCETCKEPVQFVEIPKWEFDLARIDVTYDRPQAFEMDRLPRNVYRRHAGNLEPMLVKVVPISMKCRYDDSR